MRDALLVAYHFPPAAISSGHLRTLALARYLPALGWQPTVLTAHPRAYSRVDERSLKDIPDDIQVSRAFALDTRKHLSFRGAYPVVLAQPDRWASWWLGAVAAGMRIIRRDKPSLIWSTYPIVSAHLIAYTLHRLSGIPWVADFRDPITTADIGDSPLTAKTRGAIERRVVGHASRCVFTTKGARELYAKRYPDAADRLSVVPNGYDERDFKDFEEQAKSPGADGVVRLVHSGVLYRDGRDPTPFLTALAALLEAGRRRDSVRVTFRACGDEPYYRDLIASLGLDDVVQIEPAIPYAEAIREQANADGLLLFQGSIYNRQIPAKVYEYLRVGRPILALADPAGDSANLLAEENIGAIAPIDDSEGIKGVLGQFLRRVESGEIAPLSRDRIANYSREAAVTKYAEIFRETAAG